MNRIQRRIGTCLMILVGFSACSQAGPAQRPGATGGEPGNGGTSGQGGSPGSGGNTGGSGSGGQVPDPGRGAGGSIVLSTGGASGTGAGGTAGVTGTGGTAGAGTVTPPPPSLSFKPATSYPTGRQPHWVRAADFNRDGILDLLVVNTQDATLGMLIGNGDGSFQAQKTFPTAADSEPQSVVISDINTDNALELVTANKKGSSTSVFPGNYDATWKPQVGYPACSGSQDIAVGDVDKDGKVDIVLVGPGEASVCVIINLGATAFKPVTKFPVGDEPQSVAMGDFNGDGYNDIATANHASSNVSVLINKGSGGGFAAHVTYPAGTGPRAIRVGDFNNDGKADLVVASDGSDSVSVHIGNGDGTFKAKSDCATGKTPTAVIVGDLNKDGKFDIVTSNIWGNAADLVHKGGDSVSVLLGNGDGTFQPKVDFTVGQGPFSVYMGDLNGDGKRDLVTANGWDGTVSVLLAQ